jgi:DNA (cytosine-5)-methyltransferase 1
MVSKAGRLAMAPSYEERGTGSTRGRGMNLRYASLCTGISCESVAWMPLGWTPVFFSEIDPFARALLEHHYPAVPNLGDMTKVDGAAWRGKVDVLIAGTPCQSFSVAGKRGSLSDARGNLALVYARIIHDADVPVSVWENVPGVLSTKDNAFGQFLGALVGAEEPLESGRPKGKWPGAGLVAGPKRIAAFRTLDARYFGVAQRRRRVFVVSVRAGDGIHPGAILFEPESLPRDSAAGTEAGANVARSLTGSTGGASGKEQQLTFVSGAGEPLNALPSDAEPLCMAHGQGGAEVRRDQCPTLSCNHEAPIALSTALTPKWSQDKAFTLTQPSCSGGGQPQAVAHMYPLQEINRRPSQNGRGFGDEGDPMFTLQANSQHGVAHIPRGEGHGAPEDGTGRGVPLCLQGNMIGREDHSGPNGSGVNRDLAFTLNSSDRHGVCSMVHWAQGGGEIEDETAGTLRAEAEHNYQFLRQEMAVRRLTPRECERLQGLPDDYTLIPFGKGGRQKDIAEMASYWGVSVEDASTLAAYSHRYRAVGNGMAAPVVRWIGRRIALMLELRGYEPIGTGERK